MLFYLTHVPGCNDSFVPGTDHIRSRAFSEVKRVSNHGRFRNLTDVSNADVFESPSQTSRPSCPAASDISKCCTLPRNQNATTSHTKTSTGGPSPWGSLESFSCDDECLLREEVVCLMPTGIILDVSVNPDFDITHIKDLAVKTAMNNGKALFAKCYITDF